MFLKACESAFAHTGLMTQTVKAGICFSRWGRHRWGNEKYNSWLLDFTNQDKTLKVLEHLQENADPAYKLDNADLIIFDKLSESANSESHRVFDLYYKKFFALKTVSLDTETGWKEVNLMLKQHFNEMNRLAPVRSFTYDKSEKKVRILSELEKTVVGEFAYFCKKQGLKWSSGELKAVLWHLLKIVKTLKSHETRVEYLKADDIFLDSKDGKLKAFDYPGAIIGHNLGFQNWGMQFSDQDSFEVAVHTLVKIADPHAPVDNPEEARAYLSVNYPEFKEDFLEVELAAKGSKHLFQSDLLPLKEIFENKDFDKYLFEKLKKTFDQKPGRKNEEDWALVNQGLGRFDEAESILKSLVHENINRFGITHPIVTKNYFHLAELYQAQANDDLASKYYQNALNSSRSDAQHDKELLARLHLKYGKFLMTIEPENRQFAMSEFEKAYELLKDKKSSKSRLLNEIEKALENIKNDNYDPSNNGHSNSEGNERKRWKKGKIIKIIFYLWLLNWISKTWFPQDKKDDGDHQNTQVQEIKKSDQPKPVVTKIEPQINNQDEPVVVVTVTHEKPAKVENVEPSLPKVVDVPTDELTQDSKFAWFLFGLNIAIGFAGLTLPSAN